MSTVLTLLIVAASGCIVGFALCYLLMAPPSDRARSVSGSDPGAPGAPLPVDLDWPAAPLEILDTGGELPEERARATRYDDPMFAPPPALAKEPPQGPQSPPLTARHLEPGWELEAFAAAFDGAKLRADDLTAHDAAWLAGEAERV